MASHNRMDRTLNCLRSIHEETPSEWQVEVILVDDASSDGTFEAVQEKFPEVKIVRGPGNWFWAKSMSVAQSHIHNSPDLVIWVNDDIELLPTALFKVQEAVMQHPNTILVGQFADSELKRITYGGLRKKGRHPFKYNLILAKHQFEPADVFHGNLVVIPSEVMFQVGEIDGSFDHAYADYDYALRASKLGNRILVIPGFLGICKDHAFSWPDNLLDRFRFLNSKKGLPLKSQVRYLRRHGPVGWPLYLIPPYIRAIFKVPGKSDLHKDSQ